MTDMDLPASYDEVWVCARVRAESIEVARSWLAGLAVAPEGHYGV